MFRRIGLQSVMVLCGDHLRTTSPELRFCGWTKHPSKCSQALLSHEAHLFLKYGLTCNIFDPCFVNCIGGDDESSLQWIISDDQS
jgi:hypothetical protein